MKRAVVGILAHVDAGKTRVTVPGSGVLQKNFGLDDESALDMAKLAKGYPFAFQVLGYFARARLLLKRGTRVSNYRIALHRSSDRESAPLPQVTARVELSGVWRYATGLFACGV